MGSVKTLKKCGKLVVKKKIKFMIARKSMTARKAWLDLFYVGLKLNLD